MFSRRHEHHHHQHCQGAIIGGHSASNISSSWCHSSDLVALSASASSSFAGPTTTTRAGAWTPTIAASPTAAPQVPTAAATTVSAFIDTFFSPLSLSFAGKAETTTTASNAANDETPSAARGYQSKDTIGTVGEDEEDDDEDTYVTATTPRLQQQEDERCGRGQLSTAEVVAAGNLSPSAFEATASSFPTMTGATTTPNTSFPRPALSGNVATAAVPALAAPTITIVPAIATTALHAAAAANSVQSCRVALGLAYAAGGAACFWSLLLSRDEAKGRTALHVAIDAAGGGGRAAPTTTSRNDAALFLIECAEGGIAQFLSREEEEQQQQLAPLIDDGGNDASANGRTSNVVVQTSPPSLLDLPELKKGMTPLHLAISNANYALAARLVGAGCSVNVKDADGGNTPLHYALLYTRARPRPASQTATAAPLPPSPPPKTTIDYVRLLLGAGSEVLTATNDYGQMPLDIVGRRSVSAVGLTLRGEMVMMEGV